VIPQRVGAEEGALDRCPGSLGRHAAQNRPEDGCSVRKPASGWALCAVLPKALILIGPPACFHRDKALGAFASFQSLQWRAWFLQHPRRRRGSLWAAPGSS
jgi:hypothetical protein